MKTFAIPVLPALLLATLLTACGTARTGTPSQRYEYRTGHSATRPAQRESASQKRHAEAREKTGPGKKESGKSGSRKGRSDVSTLKGRELIGYAKKSLKAPYKAGGNGPEAFDCSGFTVYVYKHFGIRLPRNSADQFAVGMPVRDTADLQPGDLVFFARNGKIFHVGLAVEAFEDHFTFIHAGSSTGVTVSRSDGSYWSPLYYGAKRIL